MCTFKSAIEVSAHHSTHQIGWSIHLYENMWENVPIIDIMMFGLHGWHSLEKQKAHMTLWSLSCAIPVSSVILSCYPINSKPLWKPFFYSQTPGAINSNAHVLYTWKIIHTSKNHYTSINAISIWPRVVIVRFVSRIFSVVFFCYLDRSHFLIFSLSHLNRCRYAFTFVTYHLKPFTEF